MKGSKIADQAALVTVAEEAIAEAAYVLATCQESNDQGGIRAAIAVLQAIANKGTKQTRERIREELAGYVIPFCALQIGSTEEEELAQ